MGEEMENEPVKDYSSLTMSCHLCSFVTESYKEFFKHRRMHKNRKFQIDNSHLRRHLKRKCRDKPDSPMEVRWKKAMAEAKEESDT